MKREPKNIIGPKLRRLRTSAKLSIEELAARVVDRGGELSVVAIDKIEKRKRRIIDREFVCLAAALGVAVEKLFPRPRK